MKVVMILGVYLFLKVLILIVNESDINITVPRTVQRLSYGMVSFFMAQAIGMFS